jgi:hypothetical protein
MKTKTYHGVIMQVRGEKLDMPIHYSAEYEENENGTLEENRNSKNTARQRAMRIALIEAGFDFSKK